MKTIGIIGASLIGTGITYNLIMADFTIYLIDISNDKLGKAIHNIKLHLEEATKADLINQDDIKKKLNSIKSSTKLEDIPANIDLVIECVPEDINIKTSVFNTLDKVCNKNTIFATNTSSISVTKLSKSTTRPDKFIGIHFIPPTETNELIELIPIETTSKETLSIIEKFAERIEKITIISKDSPGFCLNRFLLPILNEAAILVDTNKYRNEIYTINYALKDAFKAPSGPFEIMNAIGTTYTYKASNELAQELGDFYRPCEFLKEQAQNNTLWDLPEINKYKDMEAAAFHDTPEIKKMFQGIVFGVCTKLVEEKIASITDINLAAKIGLGWQYGPFEAINDYGPSKTAYLIEEYANNNIYLPVVKNIEDIDNWPIYTTKYYTENNTSFIKLNRPDKTNSINKSLLIELNKHLNTAISDENSKVIVITGSPGCFSTGIDTDYFITSLRRNRIEDITNFIKLAQSTFNKIAESTKPIIALVDGITHSAGLELALSCHFIIATERSTFNFPETSLGLFPCLGSTYRLPKRTGSELAKYLILLGKHINANKAVEFGLIDNLVKNKTELDTLIEKIANLPEANIDNIYKEYKQPQNVSPELSKYIKLLRNVDLLITKKLISKKAKELTQELDNKPLNTINIANNLIESGAKSTIEKVMQQEIRYLNEVLQQYDIESKLKNLSNEKIEESILA